MRDLLEWRFDAPVRMLLISLATGGLALFVGWFGAKIGIQPILAVAGLLIAGVFLASRPALPLAILLAGFYYYPLIFDRLGMEVSSTTTLLFYSLVVSSSVIGVLRRNSKRLDALITAPASLSLLAFFIWMLVNSLLLTPFFDETRQKLGFALLLMLAPYFGAGLLDSQTQKRFVFFVIALGVVGVFLAALTFLSNPDMFGTGRFVLSQRNSPLVMAYALGISAVFALAVALNSARRSIWFMTVGLIGIASLIIVLSGSRGPLIALALASLTMVLSKVRSRRLEIVLGLIAIAILIVLLAPLTPGWARFERLVDVVKALQETGNVDEQRLAVATSGRTAIWQDSISAWRGSPLVGVGLGNYPEGVFSHNFAIEILTELGLLGIALFILFFSTVVLSLRRLMTQSDDPMMARLIVGLLVFALMHMSFSGRLQTITDFWLAAGLACGLGLNPGARRGGPAAAATTNSDDTIRNGRKITHPESGGVGTAQ